MIRTSFPIAETFHSIQGEGQWVGTPMHFIRLAGCNVGRPARAVKVEESSFPILPTGKTAMVCHSWDGRGFPCDTDYDVRFNLTFKQLLSDTYEKHICLTGGEPLIHKGVPDFVILAKDQGLTLHIETSGTVYVDKNDLPCWVTVSPKIGCDDRMLRQADEVKLLVDEFFDVDNLTPAMREHRNVFLCPINEVMAVRSDNVGRCLELLKLFPNWRLSFQAHKFLNLR